MTTGGFRHLEELRDMLGKLKYDAQFLYQYGELGVSAALFNSLSSVDQVRLLYLALTEGGGTDVKNVARQFLDELGLAPRKPEDLLDRLSPEIRAELLGLKEALVTEPKPLGETDRQRITEELRKACEKIGSLRVEEAYWILLPYEPNEESTWIEAVGGKDEPLARFRSSFQAIYNPKEEERYNLLTYMRQALWIIHAHNHPKSQSPGYITLCLPSGNDIGFAAGWKSVRPELAARMKFFVIQEAQAVEYALPLPVFVRWL